MYTRIHAAAVDGEAVYLFAKLRGRVFTALKLHTAAFYDISAADLFILKLGNTVCKRPCLAVVIIYLS